MKGLLEKIFAFSYIALCKINVLHRGFNKRCLQQNMMCIAFDIDLQGLIKISDTMLYMIVPFSYGKCFQILLNFCLLHGAHKNFIDILYAGHKFSLIFGIKKFCIKKLDFFFEKIY